MAPMLRPSDYLTSAFSSTISSTCAMVILCAPIFAVRDASGSEYSFPCHRKSNTPQLATKVKPFTTLVSLGDVVANENGQIVILPSRPLAHRRNDRVCRHREGIAHEFWSADRTMHRDRRNLLQRLKASTTPSVYITIRSSGSSLWTAVEYDAKSNTASIKPFSSIWVTRPFLTSNRGGCAAAEYRSSPQPQRITRNRQPQEQCSQQNRSS
jgi:hypothetical protein